MSSSMSVEMENTAEGLLLLGEGESFHDELCKMIASSQMFNEFSHEEISIIATYARGYEAKSGTLIFREGQKGTFMCLLVTGRVDVYKENDAHERKRITSIRAGKTMGEMSLLDDLPYSATTIAVEDSSLVLMTKTNFEKLNEEHPVLSNKILKSIARLLSLRLRQTTGILLDYLD